MARERLLEMTSKTRSAPPRAMAMLEAHLRRSLEPNIELLRKLGPLPEDRRPPYLVAAALSPSS